MGESISALILKIIVAAIILFGGIWFANRCRPHLRGQLVSRNLDPMLATFATSIVYILVVTFVVIAALSELGIHTTSLIAIVGAAGLAVGLSLQNSLSSFAAGIMIIGLRPFQVGDYIEAGGTTGIVEEIQIFYTKMRTADNRTVIVPNAGIISDNIVNYSDRDTRRVDMVFGISYHDDIKMAKVILQNVLEQDERILTDPEPTIAVSQLGDSSVNLIVRPWVKTDDYWPVLWDLTEAIKLRFDQEGIRIPYPQRDVHLHQAA